MRRHPERPEGENRFSGANQVRPQTHFAMSRKRLLSPQRWSTKNIYEDTLSWTNIHTARVGLKDDLLLFPGVVYPTADRSNCWSLWRFHQSYQIHTNNLFGKKRNSSQRTSRAGVAVARSRAPHLGRGGGRRWGAVAVGGVEWWRKGIATFVASCY